MQFFPLVLLLLIVSYPAKASDSSSMLHDRISNVAAEATVSGVVAAEPTQPTIKSVSDRLHAFVGGFVKMKRSEHSVTQKSQENTNQVLDERKNNAAAKQADRKMSSYADKKKSAIKLRQDTQSMKTSTTG